MSSYIDTMMSLTVFGVELDFLLQREAVNGEVQPGAIPSVLDRLIREVEAILDFVDNGGVALVSPSQRYQGASHW